MMRKLLIAGCSLFGLLFLIVILRGHLSKNEFEPLKVYISAKPISADPIDYDLSQHHQCFRSVLGTLTTLYKRGGLTGQVASGWSRLNEGRSWRFDLRRDLLWENGEQVTAHQVAASFKRYILIVRAKGSRYPLFENLVDIHTLKRMDDVFGGIEVLNKDQIVFHFKEPLDRVLELLAFGHMAIVHPNDYDPVSGAWKDKKKITALGPYKVKSWTDSEYVLELRKEYPKDLRHERAFLEIQMRWDDPKRDVDFRPGNSYETFDGLTFYGPAPASMTFLRCISWRLKESPCHNKEVRVALRRGIFHYFSQHGTEVPKSFFPPVLFEPEAAFADFGDYSALEDLRGKTIRLKNFLASPANVQTQRALEYLGSRFGFRVEVVHVPIEELVRQLDPELSAYSIDLSLMGTSVLVEEPKSDIHYMFHSKEGVRTPDLDGSIRRLTDGAYTIGDLEKKISEQALFWSISHYSRGFWAAARVDAFQTSLIQTPIDFSFVGAR